MSFEVKILAHSITPLNIEAVTWEIRYPRFIHSEFMTHRVLERNAASSRAIPILKMLKSILLDMATPIHWGANKAGMQASEELTGIRLFLASSIWRMAGLSAVVFSYLMHLVGAHKQIANRITEPYSHIRVVVTGVHWENFFSLRAHKDAQPEFQYLALRMLSELEKSKPTKLKPGQWHLPYISMDDYGNYMYTVDGKERVLSESAAIQHSAALCAATSYKTVDGKVMTPEKAEEICKKLFGSVPLHASPAGHQLTPDTYKVRKGKVIWDNPHLHGPMFGFKSYRKMLPGEFNDEYAHLK